MMPQRLAATRFDLDNRAVSAWFAQQSRLLGASNASLYLDAEDMRREATWRGAKDRRAFRAGRILARKALSEISADQGAHWPFQYRPSGRPELRDHPAISVSISHSGDCAAVAISSVLDVGIDVERIAAAAEIGIVDDVLTRSERMWLHGLDASDREDHFIRLWTLKEACAKALADDLNDWRDIDASNPKALLVRGRLVQATSWQHRFACAGENYHMSIVSLQRSQPATKKPSPGIGSQGSAYY